MSNFISSEEWDKYRTQINDFHNDAFQQDITWRKVVVKNDLHGEGDSIKTIDINLKGLIRYNDFRSWPLTDVKDTGELDQQSCLVYFNINYLKENNYTNTSDQLNYNPAMDRFIVDGVEYKSFGDSKSAQASNSALLFFIILKRHPISTGSTRYSE